MPATPPVTVEEFKSYFVRDFPYGPGTDKVMDADVDRALNEALSVFNAALWTTEEKPVAFRYAAAHFLVRNIQAAGGLSGPGAAGGPGGGGSGASNQGRGPIASKSVGAVSLNYQLPPGLAESAILSQFLTTDYGIRYLQMAAPRLIGGVSVVQGPRDPDIAIPNIPFM